MQVHIFSKTIPIWERLEKNQYRTQSPFVGSCRETSGAANVDWTKTRCKAYEGRCLSVTVPITGTDLPNFQSLTLWLDQPLGGPLSAYISYSWISWSGNSRGNWVGNVVEVVWLRNFWPIKLMYIIYLDNDKTWSCIRVYGKPIDRLLNLLRLHLLRIREIQNTTFDWQRPETP